MKKLFYSASLFILLFIFLSAVTKPTPFWKGNMHTHSYWSDGNTFPEEVAWWYKSHGYNFLAVTDHNLLQEGEKWYHVDRNETTRKTYENYLEHFGGVGLQTEKRGEQLWAKLRTLEDYRAQFEKTGEFLLISGEEISDAAENKPVHLNGINLSTVVIPAEGDLLAECLKRNVQEIRNALSQDGNPEWIIVNHPNFGWALTAKDIDLSGARFFEVFNGHPSVNNYGSDTQPGTELMWDEINRGRIEKDEALIFGIANDDSHHFLEFQAGRANPGRGWSMVRSRELSPEALYEAMINGDFYGSTGIELKNFVRNGKQIKIEINAEKDVQYTTIFLALFEGDSKAQVVGEQSGSKAKYVFKGQELMVRAKITSTKLKENPYQEGDLEMAWIQPIQPKK